MLPRPSAASLSNPDETRSLSGIYRIKLMMQRTACITLPGPAARDLSRRALLRGSAHGLKRNYAAAMSTAIWPIQKKNIHSMISALISALSCLVISLICAASRIESISWCSSPSDCCVGLSWVSNCGGLVCGKFRGGAQATLPRAAQFADHCCTLLPGCLVRGLERGKKFENLAGQSLGQTANFQFQLFNLRHLKKYYNAVPRLQAWGPTAQTVPEPQHAG
jgi:hypothetical protein